VAVVLVVSHVAVESIKMVGWNLMDTLLPEPGAGTTVTPAKPTIVNGPLLPVSDDDENRGIG